MNTTVYVCRHGEVENPGNIFYGRIPGFHLSQKGKAQAKALGLRLATLPITAIYSSPLERTQETAQGVLDVFPNLSLQLDERLIEVYSPLQGRPVAEMEKQNWDMYKEEYFAQGGETVEQIAGRLQSAIHELIYRHAGEHIVIVSHGDPVMIAKIICLNKPVRYPDFRAGKYVGHTSGFRFTFGAHRAIDSWEPIGDLWF